MNTQIVEAIAASRFAQSERVALLALGRGRALETDAFLCAKGEAPDLLVYPPRIWDRPQKALAALLKLSGARWVTHTRSGWMLMESVVAGAATSVACGTHHSQERLDIGADDLRAAKSVSSETGPRLVSDETRGSPNNGAGFHSVSSETGLGLVSDETPPMGGRGERLNVKTFLKDNVQRLNVVRAAVRAFVGENDYAHWWERRKYLWDIPERVECLERSLRYLRAGVESGETIIRTNRGRTLWAQAQRDWLQSKAEVHGEAPAMAIDKRAAAQILAKGSE